MEQQKQQRKHPWHGMSDVEQHFLEQHEHTAAASMSAAAEPQATDPAFQCLRQQEPEIFALTRNRFPVQPPTGKRLELIKQQLLRTHRAAGHSSFSNLQRVLTLQMDSGR